MITVSATACSSLNLRLDLPSTTFHPSYFTQNTEGRVVEERYFDAEGNPVKRYDDYYGIVYEYENDTVKITYLGDDGLPIMHSAGYAVIMRTVGREGQAIDDYYYDLDM